MSKPVIKKPEIPDKDTVQKSAYIISGDSRHSAELSYQAGIDYCYKEMLKEVIEYLKQHTEVAFGIPYINQKAITALQSQLEWDEDEAEADKDIKEGRTKTFQSADEAIKYLHNEAQLEE